MRGLGGILALGSVSGGQPIVDEEDRMLVCHLAIGIEVAHANVVWFQVVVHKPEAVESLQQGGELDPNLHDRFEWKQATPWIHYVLESTPKSVDDQEWRFLVLAVAFQQGEPVHLSLSKSFYDGQFQVEHCLIVRTFHNNILTRDSIKSGINFTKGPAASLS